MGGQMGTQTGKQRMLDAYRAFSGDRMPIAPELWYYYPAKLLGVDMIAFEREVPFHEALKTTFEHFRCEGRGVAFAGVPNERASGASSDVWLDADTLEVRYTTHTPRGDLAGRQRYSRSEPSWCIERPVKDLARDLPAGELAALGGNPEALDCSPLTRARQGVGESYLLEAWLAACVGIPLRPTRPRHLVARPA